MSESQIIEYKSNWRDEYLKWICGFANAQGGSLFIGMDDNGQILGLVNAKRLLEELPNKITSVLGIVATVNLHHSVQGDYIEIVVDPHPNPVSYKGEYHFRSGSTKQELRGVALDKFLLMKYGKRWDGVSIPNVKIEELNFDSMRLFIAKGIDSNRIDGNNSNYSAEQLLENLNLLEDGHLKRAAILLFHPTPEKFIPGAYIKIGFFRTESDLQFQDEIHGNLFEQIDKSVDLLLTKYTKALIDYRGLSRIESHEYPKDALREALLNSISHKDYAGGVPIQIRVYIDRLMIWNEGRLPEDWTVKNLLQSHPSRPFNPDIANAFFRSGFVESWGRGISKIVEQLRIAGLPDPIFTNEGSDFWVIFRKDIYNQEHLGKMGLNHRQVDALLFFKAKGIITTSEYARKYDVSDRTARRDLVELVDRKLLSSEGDKKLSRYKYR